MKTRSQLMKRFATVALSALFVSTLAFADGGSSDVFVKGTSHTDAGDFVVSGTEDLYYFQGQEYQVCEVFYDNPRHNMKIAVGTSEDCHSYIAYTDSYWFQYTCSKDGFGVRKVMFNNPVIGDTFNAEQFHAQSVLVKARKVAPQQAVSLIAAYLPKLQS
ncbi:MAG: hypothetical protein R2751_02585 [Bacteroidales bacterium]